MAETKDQIADLLERLRAGELDEESLVAQLEDLAAIGSQNSEDGVSEDESEEPDPDSEAAPDVIAKLDAYRAAEASGAETVAAWAELTGDKTLAGGLRVIAAREAAHAELLETRLTELGGAVEAVVPEWLSKYNAAILNPSASDVDRLGAIVAQFPDPEAAVDRIRDLAAALYEDSLTCELLMSICDDEIATLRWIHEAYAERKKHGRNSSGA